MPILKRDKNKINQMLLIYKKIKNPIYFYDFRKLQL
jgi:hypothetical protein